MTDTSTPTLLAEAPSGAFGHDGFRPPGRMADRSFRIVAQSAGLLVLLVLGLIIYSTVEESWSWFELEGFGTVFSNDWSPSEGHFGALPLVYGTVLVSVIALVLAVPVSIGIALFVTEVAPRRARAAIISVIDLLAAIPSVVFGLWGLKQLAPQLPDLFSSVSDATQGIPIMEKVFASPSASGLSFMTGGIVVAIMITPIITAISREVFATCPAAQKEAALAMGATRWEMIRGAVFPHSRSGVTAAVILGLGRAMGETIAVALVVGSSPQLTERILGPGDTMAAVVAFQFGEASGDFRAALIGLGVVLLGLTVVVGMIGRMILVRGNRRLGLEH